MENLALRQQLSVLKRWHPRPKLMPADRLFWLLARRRWSGWKGALTLVSPETMVRWHRAGFRVLEHVLEEGEGFLGVHLVSGLPGSRKIYREF
jgi:hypothetical protein